MHLIPKARGACFSLFAAGLVAAWPANAQDRGTMGHYLQLDGSRPYLGIVMEEVKPENMAAYKLNSERGVIVRSVEKGSPAETAGLQEKDVILDYAGTAILSTRQFARLVSETPAGRSVEIGISRDGRKMTLSAKIGEKDEPLGFTLRSGPDGAPELGGRAFRFRRPDDNTFDLRVLPSPRSLSGDRTPRLGVTLQELSEQMAGFLGVPGGKGVLVTSVLEGSAAAAARLKAGDVVVKAGEQIIESPEDLQRSMDRAQPGSKMDLTIIRDKREMTVQVEFSKAKDQSSGYRL